MKVLCIILARSNSKSIKNKNLLNIKNKTLLQLTSEFALKLNFLDKVLFNSNSKKYLKLAKKYGIKDVYLRPRYLSKNNTTSLEVIKDYIIKTNSFDFTHILILQPTTPFRKLEHFKKAFNLLRNSKFDSVITINKVKDEPERMLTINKKNIISNFLKKKNFSFVSRQKLKQKFIRSGSMYFFKTSNIIRYNSVLGKNNYGLEVNGKYSINIDSIEDYNLAKIYI
tara:strand:- start:686 stop:1360 length:675 start_codon:yes stop_codon:yes gene_type:complete